jgi:hypothetical protein
MARRSLDAMMHDIRDAVDPSDLDFAKRHSSRMRPNQTIAAMQFGGKRGPTAVPVEKGDGSKYFNVMGLIGATVLIGVLVYWTIKDDEKR